jgi:coatomer subunit gamma
MFSLPALEHKLVVYISSEDFSQPFDLEDIPVITKEESDAQALHTLKTAYTPDPISKAATSKTSATESVMATSQKLTSALAEVPEFKDFGPVLKTSATSVELTEKETEYAVTAHKHIFKEHIVLQVHPSHSPLTIVYYIKYPSGYCSRERVHAVNSR